jgi:hypothetical protein
MHLEQQDRRLIPGFGLADQDIDKVFRVEFRVISVVSNCVHHILRSKRISFIRMRTSVRFLTRTPFAGPSSSSSSFSASVASGSSPIWTNCMPSLCKGTCLASRRRAESTIACLGSSASPMVSVYSNGTEPIGYSLGLPSVITRILMGLWL